MMPVFDRSGFGTEDLQKIYRRFIDLLVTRIFKLQAIFYLG